MSKDLFSEEEATAILSEAIKKRTQSEYSTSGPITKEGLTLQDIQRIGSEVGLTPEEVADAAEHCRSVSVPDDERHLLGIPPYATFEATVRGEMDSERWNRMLPAIRQYYGEAGTSDEQQGRFEWKPGQDHVGSIVVRTINGKTHVSITRDYNVGIWLTFIVASVVSLISSLILFKSLTPELSKQGAFIACLGLIMVIAVIVRLLFANFYKKDQTWKSSLLKELCEIAEDSPTASSHVQVDEPLIERLQTNS